MNVRKSPGKSHGVIVYNNIGMAGAADLASLALSPLWLTQPFPCTVRHCSPGAEAALKPSTPVFKS